MPSSTEDRVPLTVYVTPEQKRALKMRAVREDLSMTQLVVGSIIQLTEESTARVSTEAVPKRVPLIGEVGPEPPCKCDHPEGRHRIVGSERKNCRDCGCLSYRPHVQ